MPCQKYQPPPIRWPVIVWTGLKSIYESIICLFLCFKSYPENVEEYIPTFYKIRYISEELYVAVMWIISQHFVIFGTKRVSRNSGITNFETLFSAKFQIGFKNFLKSTFLANFSVLKVKIQSIIKSLLTYFCQGGKKMLEKYFNKRVVEELLKN